MNIIVACTTTTTTTNNNNNNNNAAAAAAAAADDDDDDDDYYYYYYYYYATSIIAAPRQTYWDQTGLSAKSVLFISISISLTLVHRNSDAGVIQQESPAVADKPARRLRNPKRNKINCRFCRKTPSTRFTVTPMS